MSRWVCIVAALGLIGAQTVLAQQQGRPPGQQRGALERPGADDVLTTDPAKQLNDKLAAWLILENRGEIAVSQFAQERATTDAVKQFAQKMVREHSEMNDKLQQLTLGAVPPGQQRGAAGATGVQRGQSPAGQQTQAQPGQQTQDQPGQRAGGQPATAPGMQPVFQGGVAGIRDPLLIIAQDVMKRFTELTQEELARHQGVEFDVAFMGQQLVNHLGTLATLQSFQQHADDKLQPIIDQATQATKQHLAQARDIMQQLETQAAATARRGQEGRQQQ